MPHACFSTHLHSLETGTPVAGWTSGMREATWAGDGQLVGLIGCNIYVTGPGRDVDAWATIGVDSPLPGCVYGAAASADGRRLAAYAETYRVDRPAQTWISLRRRPR